MARETVMCLFLPPLQRMSKHTLQDDVKDVNKCLFKSHLMLEAESLNFEPSEDEFQETLTEILEAFQECTLALPNLIPDPYFHSFTRWVGRALLGEDPSLRSRTLPKYFQSSVANVVISGAS